MADFANWSLCATAPGADASGFDGGQGPPYTPPCAAFDFDADGDVDLKDFYGLQRVFVTP